MSVEIEDLHFSYSSHEVLKGFSLSASRGEIMYVLGPNGAGKTTLFRCLMGHIKPSSGKVLINGKPTDNYSSQELAREVAYIPQSCVPSFNYSVRQIAAMGRTSHLSLFASPSEKDYRITDAALEKLGIRQLADCGISEISGGERQLALIARALSQEAKILIMDEPTSNLDYGNQLRVQSLMRTLAHEGMLVLMSSHNPQFALHFADRVAAISGGKSIACGKPEEVINSSLLSELYGGSVKVSNGLLLPEV